MTDQTTPTLAALTDLKLNRKIGAHSLPDDWQIICAGNRQSHRGSTNGPDIWDDLEHREYLDDLAADAARENAREFGPDVCNPVLTTPITLL